MNIIGIVNRFKSQKECVKHLEMIRWNGKAKCCHCGSDNVWKHPDDRNYTCNKCNKGFSVTVGTLFHDSKLPLVKWFMAISLVVNARKGISACQLMRDLNIGSYKTAWRMLRLIRTAMVDENMQQYFNSIIEMDETYIGGKPGRDFHKKKESKRGRGTHKQPVVGVIDRNSKKVYAEVATPNKEGKKLSGKQLMDILDKVCVQKSIVMTDEFKGYRTLKKKSHDHYVVDHQKEYVRGNVHTNTIESFWAILKRGVYGVYHKISLKYLQHYINEFCFRYNNRENAFEKIVNNSLLIKAS